MYCPQCGQQQPAKNVRFCSRCGFSLRIVTELLGSDGVLLERPPGESNSRLSPRQRGVRLGALLMLTSLLIAFIQALMPTLIDKLVVLAAPVVICFLVGFVRLFYALLFEEETVPARAAGLLGVNEAAMGGLAGTSLPEAHSVPVSIRPRQAATAELASPLSVTEATTSLLEKDSGALGR
jgi:hypothetical protein